MPLNHEKPSESRIPPSTVSKPHCAVVISSQPVFETTKHNRKPGDTRPVENSAVPMIDVVVALAWRRATAVASRSILVPLAENTPLRIKLLTSSLSHIHMHSLLAIHRPQWSSYSSMVWVTYRSQPRKCVNCASHGE